MFIVLGKNPPRYSQKGYATVTPGGNIIVHWQDDTKESFTGHQMFGVATVVTSNDLYTLNEISEEEYLAQFKSPNVRPGDVITREHEICLRVDTNVDKGYTCQYDGKPQINARFCWDHRITTGPGYEGRPFVIGEDQFDKWVHADGTECDHGKADKEALFDSITIPETLELVYPTLDESYFRWAIVPVNDMIRALVPWAKLPNEIRADFYCNGKDGIPTSVSHFGPVKVNPADHHGYSELSFTAYRPVSYSGWVEGSGYLDSTKKFIRTADSLGSCPECKSHYCVFRQEAYGNSTNCPDCGYHNYYSIGD